MAFAAAKISYQLAAKQLKEFGCITVSHQTVSNLIDTLSEEVKVQLSGSAEVRKKFQKAQGDTEFTTDGAFVNTLKDGGKHLRLILAILFPLP
jgi:hypothetical protein